MHSRIQMLALSDYRSYAAAELHTQGRSVFLFGPNGAGKTNLLEAISLLSPGRGLRGAPLAEVGRRLPGEAVGRAWAVSAQVEDARIGARVIMGIGCRVGGQALIQGPTVMGDGCDVRERGRVEHSVVWSNAKIGAGAVVRDSIIGSDVWIGDEAVVEGAVLANGARVKRGVRLGPGARLEPDEVAG